MYCATLKTGIKMGKGFQYDFFAEEWSHTCKACGTELYAPTKLHMQGNLWIHTHSNDCLGGW